MKIMDGLTDLMAMLAIGIVSAVAGWWLCRHFANREVASAAAAWSAKLDQVSGRLTDTVKDAKLEAAEKHQALARLTGVENEFGDCKLKASQLELDLKAASLAVTARESELQDLRGQLDTASRKMRVLPVLEASIDKLQKELPAKPAQERAQGLRLEELQLLVPKLRESETRLLGLTAQRDEELATLRAHIGEWEARQHEAARAHGAALEEMSSKDAQIGTLSALVREYEALPDRLSEANTRMAQSGREWAAAMHAKDQEIGGLWARIHELEPLAGRLKDWEAHHRSTIHAKDEEITSLIERLKATEP